MRVLLFHGLVLLVTAIYNLVVPQARAELFSDAPLGDKIGGVTVRAICVYVCFLFVYFAVFRARGRGPETSGDGAYGGYAESDDGNPDAHG